MKTFIGTALFLLAASGQLFAQSPDEDLKVLQHAWAKANYQLTDKEQQQAFENLLDQSQQAVNRHPGNADFLIWQGIIQSTYAGAKGGLGALKLAKAARKNLDQALEIDQLALQGSAYASLGSLYANVPGWPIGFGSDKKAAQMLTRALEVNPDGMETNYFYADFLLKNKDYTRAQQYFLKARQAPPLPGRPVADAGRRKMIDEALAQVQTKLD